MEDLFYKKEHLFDTTQRNSFLNGLLTDFLALVKQELGARIIDTWFKSITIDYYDAITNKIILGVPNPFIEQWLQKNYTECCQKTFNRLLNKTDLQVIFNVQENTESASILKSNQENRHLKITGFVNPKDKKNSISIFNNKKLNFNSTFNNQYTFDSFVVGPNNELAYAAAKAVAENKTTIYNPLFIYGDSGLGKTHLIHAIGNLIQEKNPEINIFYQSADKFVQDFIKAIRSNSVDMFERNFSNIDVLLLDDIQFISKKEQTQEIFFKIFNAFHSLKKQVVITSDAMPRDINGLAQRIKSRFEGGLVVDVYLPPFETILAILYKKAELYNLKLDSEVAHYLASCSILSIRELEGLLLRVIAYTTFTKASLNLNVLSQIILNKERKQIDVTFSMVISLVNFHLKVNLTALRSQNRVKNITVARHVAMYLMKKFTKKSFREIGTYLYRQDHTSVMYACSKIEEERKKNEDLNIIITKIEKELIKTI
jgi:chromosomal replication initiator protein